MSNCDFVAGRSLIDLVASRLALRAPALGAATALTRPNQSAQWQSSGRHNVPTVKMVGPNNVVTNHCVEHCDHLAHDRDDHDLVQLTSGLETIVERLEHWIPIARAHRRHVKHVTNWRPTAPDAAFSLELAALEGIGRDADEGGDLFTAHAAELGQERDQGAGQYRSDPRHGSEESVSVYERGIGSHDLDQVCVQHIDIALSLPIRRRESRSSIASSSIAAAFWAAIFSSLSWRRTVSISVSRSIASECRCARRVGMMAIKDAILAHRADRFSPEFRWLWQTASA